MWKRPHVKYSLFLPSFDETLISWQIFEKKKSLNIKFYQDPTNVSRIVLCNGRTDRHDEAKSRFSQFCKHAWNASSFTYTLWRAYGQLHLNVYERGCLYLTSPHCHPYQHNHVTINCCCPLWLDCSRNRDIISWWCLVAISTVGSRQERCLQDILVLTQRFLEY
jgi:hypothetical protein